MVVYRHMKHISSMLAAAGLAMLTATVQAAAPAAGAAPAVTQAAAPHAIGKAISEISFVTEHKPNAQAKYYLYLCTAFWCAPCRREMPEIIKEYKEMIKDNHMEVIVLSCDHHVSGALRYMELFSAPFAVVMYESEARKKLPGAPEKVVAIPYIAITDADGNVLYAGRASALKDWRKITNKQ